MAAVRAKILTHRGRVKIDSFKGVKVKGERLKVRNLGGFFNGEWSTVTAVRR